MNTEDFFKFAVFFNYDGKHPDYRLVKNEEDLLVEIQAIDPKNVIAVLGAESSYIKELKIKTKIVVEE